VKANRLVRLLTALAAAVRRRPDLDPGELIAAGGDQLHPQLDAYLDLGLTKFAIRQAGTAPVDAFIDRFCRAGESAELRPTIGSETIGASAAGAVDRMQGVRFSLRIWTGLSRGR
jgi:hypothetical protein